MVVHKVYFKIQCPFDSLGTLPPQESEIRCAVRPGKEPVFSSPSSCSHCSGTTLNQCAKCVSALYRMFQQGYIPLHFDTANPVQSLPAPIRPSLELLSK